MYRKVSLSKYGGMTGVVQVLGIYLISETSWAALVYFLRIVEKGQ